MERTKKRRSKLAGAKALVHSAVDQVVDLVSEGHESTARNVLRVTDRIPTVREPARAVNVIRRLSTQGVLGTIKLVNRAVAGTSDLALELWLSRAADAAAEEPVPMRSDAMKVEGLRQRWALDATLGLLNAVIGDRLHAADNDLTIEMCVRTGERYVAGDDHNELATVFAPTRRVALFVHGLGTTEWSWCMEGAAYHGDPGATFGALLEKDLGIAPLYLRYDTGRHVSENGRELAELLELALGGDAALPTEVILCGHSMGGLVIRSACHHAEKSGHRWLSRVRRVFCLGSPHGGAPLEKLGNLLTGALGAIDLPATLIIARLLERRSAGIKDLRHGNLVDEDWLGKDPDALVHEGKTEVPLVDRLSYHFVSATVTQDPEHPLGQLIGDLLVRTPSALGPAKNPTVEGHFPIETARFGGVMHHELQNHPAVYEVVRNACTEPG